MITCATHLIKGGWFGEDRVVFSPFSIKTGKESLKTGIRTHSWITALFLKVLGKIVELQDKNGQAFYLNKNSLVKWLNHHQGKGPSFVVAIEDACRNHAARKIQLAFKRHSPALNTLVSTFFPILKCLSSSEPMTLSPLFSQEELKSFEEDRGIADFNMKWSSLTPTYYKEHSPSETMIVGEARYNYFQDTEKKGHCFQQDAPVAFLKNVKGVKSYTKFLETTVKLFLDRYPTTRNLTDKKEPLKVALVNKLMAQYFIERGYTGVYYPGQGSVTNRFYASFVDLAPKK